MDLMVPTTSSAMVHNCQAMKERINNRNRHCCRTTELSHRKKICCSKSCGSDSNCIDENMFSKLAKSCTTKHNANYCANFPLLPHDNDSKTRIMRLKERSVAINYSKCSTFEMFVRKQDSNNSQKVSTLSRRASSTIFVLMFSQIFNIVCARPTVNEGYGASISQPAPKSPQRGIQEINPILRHRYSSKFQERLKTLHDALSTMHSANKNRLLMFANANGTSRTLALSDGVSAMKNGSYRTRNCFFSPIQCQLPYAAPQTHRMADLTADTSAERSSSGGLAMARSKVISDRNSNEVISYKTDLREEENDSTQRTISINETDDGDDRDEENTLSASVAAKRQKHTPRRTLGVRAIGASALALLSKRNDLASAELRRAQKQNQSLRPRAITLEKHNDEITAQEIENRRALLAHATTRRHQRDVRRRTPPMIFITLED